MKKILTILCLLIILTTGCQNGQERFHLDKKYYNKGEYINVDDKEFSKIKGENYILFTYNNFCNLPKPCEQIFKKFMKKYNIDFLSISFDKFKKTSLYKTVKYAPSIIIVKEGKIVTYLDADNDDDLDKYQDENKFENWIKSYIYFD